MKLPEELIEPTLAGFRIGESGWVVAWTIYPNRDGHLQVNGNSTFSQRQGGTADVKVTRVLAGFRVDLSRADGIGDRSFGTYSPHTNPIPVVELIGYD